MSVQANTNYASRNVQYRSSNKSVPVEKTFSVPVQQERENVITAAPIRQSDAKRSSIDSLGPNAPDSVRDAWDKAEQETGANGSGQRPDGFVTHITAMQTLEITQRLRMGHSDLLGDSVESARDAAQRALDMMSSSLWVQSSASVGELQKNEKSFYRAFLKNLYAIE